MTNSEQSVLDAIEELEHEDLVDWQLSRHAQRSGWDFNVNQETCSLCRKDWHGLPVVGACPGAWATEEQKTAYVEHRRALRPTVIDVRNEPSSLFSSARLLQRREIASVYGIDEALLPPGPTVSARDEQRLAAERFTERMRVRYERGLRAVRAAEAEGHLVIPAADEPFAGVPFTPAGYAVVMDRRGRALRPIGNSPFPTQATSGATASHLVLDEPHAIAVVVDWTPWENRRRPDPLD
jgi:hypothetical protein